MTWSGTGTFSPPLPPDFPATSGDIIYAGRFNNVINQICTGMGNSLTRDGQNTPSINLPMAGFRHTGVGDGVNATDYASKGQLDAVAVTANGQKGLYGTRGLVGNPNAVASKYDLSCDIVTMRSAAAGSITQYAVPLTTCDLTLAGITANGRDQVAAFGINSFVHLYFIWNGVSMATLASASAPPNGPSALPAGYTHWCYASCLRLDGAGNVVRMLTRGNRTWYDVFNTTGGITRILDSGQATVTTAVSAAVVVPPNASMANLRLELDYFSANPSIGTRVAAYFRPTGSPALMSPMVAVLTVLNAQRHYGFTVIDFPLGTSQQIDYTLGDSAIGAMMTGGGLNITVQGFTLPNGGA